VAAADDHIVSAQDETAERERHQRHQQAVAPRGAWDLLQPRRADVELAERLGQTAQVVHPDEDGGLRKYVVEREEHSIGTAQRHQPVVDEGDT